MKKIFVALSMVAFALVGCDDSSSAFAGPNDEPAVESSSAAEHSSSSSSAQKNSSSSEKAKSSSSDTRSDAKQSSSSEKDKSSSSSAEMQSSSSETVANSSSSVSELSSSSLDGFDWSLPKETYLNPEIEYDTIIDSRDGKVYRTVEIGDQIWMAENLNYADSVKTASLKGKSWCYKNVAANCDVAGRLYTWAAAIDSVKLATDEDNPQDCGYGKTCEVASAGSATLIQGICPSGWHLPSNEEWSALFTAVGGRATAGAKLKSQTGWTAIDGITNEDAYGFSALPAGIRDNIGFFYNGGNLAYFWSATEYNSYYAYFMFLNYDFELADLNYYYKYYGFSVRCLKD